MIAVDSSVWIALIRDRDTPEVMRLRSIANPSDIVVGDIVLLEVLRGVRSDRHAAYLQKELATFTLATMLSPDIAIKAAGNFRRLLAKGITIRKTADLIIGTYCMEHGHSLLHADRDFDPMAEHLGLRIA